MKILLVDNHSKHIKELLQDLRSEFVRVEDFQKLGSISIADYDKIILSGGSYLPVIYNPDKYRKELELIRSCNKPLLGICLGFELVCHAFDEQLRQLKHRERGMVRIELAFEDPLFDGIPKSFEVYESHRWVVPTTKNMITLAKSKQGVEAVKHSSRQIYGVQFHPEVFVDKGFSFNIIKNFLKI